ncbi:MAG TPA: protein kinase [Clostridia bacterium]|nr:protein kinase [Clostridia bacterium]
MPQPAQSGFGRYEIESVLGVGGMGEVHLAHDTVLRRRVAIKVLTPAAARNPENLRRFEREAHAASSLNHPNILTIYEIGTADDRYFIASEFIEGESLRQHLCNGPLPVRRIVDIAYQVSCAMGAAHSAGIVHRDIKPENIMIRPDHLVKVLDFGLAKLTEPRLPDADSVTTAGLSSTTPGVLVGTLPYMSPEQVRSQNVDARTDIWSLGVVLYEMVTGRRPFEGETTSDILAAILKSDVPDRADYPQHTPAELIRIITKALQKDADERYQSAEDLASDLKSLSRRLEFEAEFERNCSQVSGLETRQPPGIGAPVSRPYVGRAPVVAAALITVALLATYLFWSRYSGAMEGEEINSIAVLPFANASNDPELEYLADGLSEGIINNLAQLPGLKVISRSSTSRYRSGAVDPKAVARELGVEAIVAGRITQREDNLQISAEVVSARDSTRLWGGQYTRRAEGWLAVQSDVSEEIARRLRRKLSAGQTEQLVKRETANPQAYELLLKGRALWRKGGNENSRKAIDYYQQAIVLDPNYALAYAYLAGSYKSLIGNGLLDPGEFKTAAEAAARRALELDQNLADAHYILANIKTDAWEWAQAEREFRRAIELNPNLAAAHNAYSAYLAVVGRHEESIASIRRARELDPLSLMIHANVGYRLYFARRYDEAIESLKHTLQRDQDYALAHLLLGYTYAAKGMYADAIASYQQAAKSGLDSPGTQIFLGAAYAKAGDREKALAVLKRIRTARDYVSPGELAVLHAALDQRDRAFALLEQAYEVHDLQLQYIGTDPAFDNLRGDPRFDALLKRIGLKGA